MTFCPEHPKRDQNPKFTSLSETTSIPVHFIWESPPPPPPTPGFVPTCRVRFQKRRSSLQMYDLEYFSFFKREKNVTTLVIGGSEIEKGRQKTRWVRTRLGAKSSSFVALVVALYLATVTCNVTFVLRMIFSAFLNRYEPGVFTKCGLFCCYDVKQLQSWPSRHFEYPQHINSNFFCHNDKVVARQESRHFHQA